MEKRRSVIKWFIIILVIILLGGFVYFRLSGESLKKDKIANKIKQIESKSNAEIKEKALKIIGECDIKDNHKKEACEILKAGIREDFSLCDEKLKGESKASCYGFVAARKNQPEICEKVEDKTVCRLAYSFNSFDGTKCPSKEEIDELIKKREMQEERYYTSIIPVSGVLLTLCNQVLPELKKSLDISYEDCKKGREISQMFKGDEEEKRSQCFSMLAGIELNERYCNEISDEIEKDNCKSLVEDAIQNITNQCREVIKNKNFDSSKDMCFYVLAKQQGSKEYCELIWENPYREKCLKLVG